MARFPIQRLVINLRAASAAAIGILLGGVTALAADPAAVVADKPDTTWFTDAGYGIFLHWGAYTTAAGRWKGVERHRDLWDAWLLNRANVSGTDYEALARTFNPSKFNPQEWATVFKEAGARYVVLTAKHHEGFAMYHSKVSNFNSYDWPADYHGDPVRELGDAVRQAGLKFGVYYSQKIDWHNNHAKGVTFEDYFYNICIPQVTELTRDYGPLAILWFDIGIGDKSEAQQLKDVVRKYQPQALISPRIGANLGDYAGGGDNEVPTAPKTPPWESCMTLNHHWGYYPQDVYQKSATDVIRLLADIRSKGGNMLLDVGPDDKGQLAPLDVLILRRVGRWLDTFGSSIYGVRATPLAPVPWGCVTSGTGNMLYLHVFEIPQRGEVLLPGIKGSIEAAWLLGDPGKAPLPVEPDRPIDYRIGLQTSQSPVDALNADDTVIAVRLAPGATFGADYLLDDDERNEFRPSAAKRGGSASYQHQRVTYSDPDDPSVEKARYDEIGAIPSAGASLAWTFRTTHSGDYHVVVDYALSGSASSQAVVQIDSEQFTLNAAPTPGDPAHPFKTERLGTVAIRTAGEHSMILRAIAATGSLKINKITLVPTRTTPLDASVDAQGRVLAPQKRGI
jgi:alpha-L-fucosidase